jgi:membrane fusion protein, copper/silver efflux system
MSQPSQEPKLEIPSPQDSPREDQLRPGQALRFNVKALVSMSYTIGMTLTAVALMFFLVGQAQKAGWISSGDHQDSGGMESGGSRYICPMMCVEPTSEPGRCPVCEMELVEATMGPVFIDPAMRRILNIQTARAVKKPVMRSLRSVGELSYNEEKLKTISAYVDGRLEQLYINTTGSIVSAGQRMALIYSPRLYAGQVELLNAKRSSPNTPMHESARRRLIELGMTESQIDQLELSNDATSRLELVAPISGTVIERLAVEGQYVAEGEPIFRLADLSSLWLILKLFPEDAALVRVGQTVSAQVQSEPGKTFSGIVEFISPTVSTDSRTVDVRVVLPNPTGHLRVGDFARAQIDVPVVASDSAADVEPMNAILVPRDAVLMVASASVVYLETEPGRFEMQSVTVGPTVGNEIVILAGLKAGDIVATRGNFLIDSQMQLAGNPSLLDPGRAEPKSLDDFRPAEIIPEFPPAGEMRRVTPRSHGQHGDHQP